MKNWTLGIGAMATALVFAGCSSAKTSIEVTVDEANAQIAAYKAYRTPKKGMGKNFEKAQAELKKAKQIQLDSLVSSSVNAATGVVNSAVSSVGGGAKELSDLLSCTEGKVAAAGITTFEAPVIDMAGTAVDGFTQSANGVLQTNIIIATSSFKEKDTVVAGAVALDSFMKEYQQKKSKKNFKGSPRHFLRNKKDLSAERRLFLTKIFAIQKANEKIAKKVWKDIASELPKFVSNLTETATKLTTRIATATKRLGNSAKALVTAGKAAKNDITAKMDFKSKMNFTKGLATGNTQAMCDAILSVGDKDLIAKAQKTATDAMTSVEKALKANAAQAQQAAMNAFDQNKQAMLKNASALDKAVIEASFALAELNVLDKMVKDWEKEGEIIGEINAQISYLNKSKELNNQFDDYFNADDKVASSSKEVDTEK